MPPVPPAHALDPRRRAVAGAEGARVVGSPPGARRVATLVFLSALSLYTVTTGGSLTSSDALVTFELTRSLVDRQSIALRGNLIGNEENRGRDGRYYSQFGLGQSLYNIPFYAAGRVAAAAVGRRIGKSDSVPKAVVAWGSAVAAAFTVAMLWTLAVRVSADARAALVAAASAAVASPLWPYSKFGMSTALTAAILASAAVLVWRAAENGSVRLATFAGGVMAFGWLTRHEMAITLLPLAAGLWAEGGRRGRPMSARLRQGAGFLLAACAGGAAWMAYNATRFGRPLFVGYSPVPGIEGYAAFLVSPAGSVLVFCPVAILWAAGLLRLRREVPALLAVLAGPLLVHYVFYAALADWPGGRSYGPRYLVPALVLLAPGLAVLLRRRVLAMRPAAVLLALLALLQAPGVLVDYSKVSGDWARTATRQEIQERNRHWASSPIVLNAVAAARGLVNNAAYLSGRRPVPSVATVGADDDRGFAQRFSFSLDFWWLYLVYLDVLPKAAGLTAALVLLAASGWCAALAWRAAPAVTRAAGG